MGKTNRAMMFPIHSKWTKKIFDRSKRYEFRNKLPKFLKPGMKIYLYETLGKMKDGITPASETNPMPRYWCSYEGSGLVVGEFTVGELFYAKDFVKGKFQDKKQQMVSLSGFGPDGNIIIKTKKELGIIGYDYQKFAIEITNVIKYDEHPICVTCTEEKGEYHKFNCRKYGMMKQNCIKFTEDKNKLTSPIPKEDFISYNKTVNFKKEVEEDSDIICEHCRYTNFGQAKVNTGPHNLCEGEGCEEATQNYLDDEANINAAPQGPMYVVEKELDGKKI